MAGYAVRVCDALQSSVAAVAAAAVASADQVAPKTDVRGKHLDAIAVVSYGSKERLSPQRRQGCSASVVSELAKAKKHGELTEMPVASLATAAAEWLNLAVPVPMMWLAAISMAMAVV
mmetsp:Transcript_95656/g.184510  ORF Transcript_95656/g.184510 Transcript_95656/m.184510 type:complete len:118 (-) Transcript_95656:918-1271(-)